MKNMRTRSGRGAAVSAAFGAGMLWLAAIGALAQENTSLKGQLGAPLYIGNLEPVRDQYGRTMVGSHLQPVRCRVELHVTSNEYVRPPTTNGTWHPYTPLLTPASVGGMGLNATGKDSGLFCMPVTQRPPTNVMVFARVFNAPTAAEATFYADSWAASVPDYSQNSLVLTFREAKPLDTNDVDGDGLCNSWEELLGTDDQLTGDYDHDGMGDLQEMLAGTALDDPSSKLSFRLVRREATPMVLAEGEAPVRPVRVRWQSVPGKTYQLEHVVQLAPDAATGATNLFYAVGDPVVAGEGEYEIDMWVDVEERLTGTFRVKLVVP